MSELLTFTGIFVALITPLYLLAFKTQYKIGKIEGYLRMNSNRNAYKPPYQKV